MMKHPFRFHLPACLVILALLLSSCLTPEGPGGDPTATAQPIFPATAVTTQDPLQPLNPTPTADLNSPNPVRITELEYLQEDTEVLVMAKLFNTLNDAILRDIQLDVQALDAVGNRIAQQRISFRYLFPRETTGLVQQFELNAGLQIATVEIRVVDGLIDRGLKYSQPLKISKPSTFRVGNDFSVTGWLENADPYTYTQVRLNAIAYNAAGQIVGGGWSIFDFVPEKDQVGFKIRVNARRGEAVHHVDVHPWITSYSASLEGGSWWNTIKKGEWNYVIDRYHQLAGGTMLKNQSDQMLTQTFYFLTVLDENDQVCQAINGYYDVIWPKEEVLFAPPPLELPKDCSGKTVDLVIVPGEYGQFPVSYNPLESSQVSFSDENHVNVSVVNNLNASISQSRVYVVLRNEEGRIVGGGYQTTEIIRSGSSLNVQVPVAYLGDPENLTVSAFATLPYGVEFGQ